MDDVHGYNGCDVLATCMLWLVPLHFCPVKHRPNEAARHHMVRVHVRRAKLAAATAGAWLSMALPPMIDQPRTDTSGNVIQPGEAR
jgi:hypothetical protein